MKFIYLIVFFVSLLKADVMSIDDLSMLVASKINKTLILDTSIQNNFLVYSNRLEKDFSLSEIEMICKKLNYKIMITKKIIYISAISKKDLNIKKTDILEQKKDLRKYKNKVMRSQLYTKIISTNMKYSRILEIAKLMDYKAIRLGAGRFLISSKIQKIKVGFFKFKPLDKYVLNGHIYELDINKIKEENINLNSLLNYASTGSNVGLSVLGTVGQDFVSTTPTSRLSLNAVFKFLVTKGFGRIMSNPVFSIFDGESIVFSSGSSVPVANASIANSRDNTISTSYKNVTVGMNIEIMPRFMLDNSINFKLNLNLTSLLSYDSVKNLVSMSSKSLTGVYNLKLNEELPLIQFISKNSNSVVSKVPILSDIPILGRLFTNISDTKNTKVTVIIFTLEKKNSLILEKNKKLIFKGGL
ncbi:MAG: hypothetical protein QM495_12810 [Lutibacter sp.]|uniref:hypothetical protein n=1 Tax=Lutibacter sp. TaxID=1925666 RepID=UPI00385C2B77